MSDRVGRRPIELVCFDLGGVLVRTRGTWEDAARAAGVPRPPTLADAAVRVDLADWMHRAAIGALNAEELFARVSQRTGWTVQQVAAISAAGLDTSYAGVDDLLTELAARDVRTACLSNTYDHHWRLLTADGRYPWMARLDFRFASHLLHCAKPDAGVYEHVEETTGVRPERIAFFDDLPENCAAAAARGWRVCRVDPAGDTARQLRATLGDWGIL